MRWNQSKGIKQSYHAPIDMHNDYVYSLNIELGIVFDKTEHALDTTTRYDTLTIRQ